MSFAHEHAAWLAIGVSRNERLLLLAYSKHACKFCGICWPGNALLQIMCVLGETAISEARQGLVGHGLIRIHAYARGGRGMATEVIVLLAGSELSTGPCGKCVDRLKTSRKARGFDVDNSNDPVDNSTNPPQAGE